MAGQPKIPAAVTSMLDRGLLELRPTAAGARAYFTEAGYVALRPFAHDRRFLDPKQYAHVRQELGLEPVVPTRYPCRSDESRSTSSARTTETKTPCHISKKDAILAPMGRRPVAPSPAAGWNGTASRAR
jgi:hypothetical protein